MENVTVPFNFKNILLLHYFFLNLYQLYVDIYLEDNSNDLFKFRAQTRAQTRPLL